MVRTPETLSPYFRIQTPEGKGDGWGMDVGGGWEEIAKKGSLLQHFI